MVKQRRTPKPQSHSPSDPESAPAVAAQVELVINRIGDLWRSHIQPNLRLIVVIALALVVLGLGIRLYNQSQTEKIARAWATVQSADNSEARRAVADTFKKKTVGEMAMFKLAQEAYRDGDVAEALTQFDDFLDRFPRATLKDEARLGRAYCMESLDQYEQAANAFEQLADDTESQTMRAQAYVGAGRCHTLLDNPEKARQSFENARAAADPDSMFAEAAMNGLQDLEEKG